MTARLVVLAAVFAATLSAGTTHATVIAGNFAGFATDIKTAGESFFAEGMPVTGVFQYTLETTTGGPVDAFRGEYVTGPDSLLQIHVGPYSIDTGLGPLNIIVQGGSILAPSAVFHVDPFGRSNPANDIAGSSTFLNLVGTNGAAIPGPGLPTTTEFNLSDIDQPFGAITINGELASFYLLTALDIHEVGEPPPIALVGPALLGFAILARRRGWLGPR